MVILSVRTDHTRRCYTSDAGFVTVTYKYLCGSLFFLKKKKNIRGSEKGLRGWKDNPDRTYVPTRTIPESTKVCTDKELISYLSTLF